MVLGWLAGYRPEWLRPDLIAGLGGGTSRTAVNRLAGARKPLLSTAPGLYDDVRSAPLTSNL